MTSPHWVSIETAMALHHSVIEIAGGSAGLREASLLMSAMARAQNRHAYGERDLFQLGATYAEAISRNHAFIDGNKRTAFMVAAVFLDQNGISPNAADGSEHAVMMEALAQGKLSSGDAAAYLRDNSSRMKV